MEPRILHILLVDDDPDLLGTMQDILRIKGFDPLPVRNAAQALAQARQQPFDVALVDLHLEDMPGLELLRTLKKDYPDSECILLTGHASQGSAIEAINAGAFSYFQKPCDIDQLVLSIQRAGEKCIAGQALRKSEAQYRLLANNVSDVIWILDLETARFTYVSPSVQALLGYSPEEMLAQGMDAALTPANLALIQKAVPEIIQRAKQGYLGPDRAEVEQPRRDGTIVWTESTTHYHLNPENGHWEAFGVSRDITERKQAEQEKALLSDTVTSSLNEIYIFDAQTLRFQFVNTGALKNLGYTFDALQAMTPLDIKPEFTLQSFEELLAPLRKREKPSLTFETIHRRADGSDYPVEVRLQLFDYGDRQVFLAIIQDITERRQAEKLQQVVYRIAQAADQGESLDSLYQSIHANISEVMPAGNFAISLVDKESGLISYPYFASELGHLPPQNAGRGLTGYVFRTAKSLLCDQALFTRLQQSGQVELIGNPAPIWLGVPLLVAGQAIGVMAVQDFRNAHTYGEREQHILEFVSSQVAMAIHRKQAEEALKLAEQKYRSIFENATEGIYQTTPDGKTISINLAGARMMGFDSPVELKNSADFLKTGFYVHPERREELHQLIAQQGMLVNAESEVRRKDGSIFWISENVHCVYDEMRNILYYEGTLVDITARKRAEDALRESEEHFRSLFENMNEGVAMHELVMDDTGQPVNYRLVDCNPQYERILGLRRSDILGRLATEAYGTEAAPFLEEYARVALSGKPSRFEGYFAPLQKYFDISIAPWGKKGFATIFSDISARKQAEAELQASREAAQDFAERLKILLETTTELSKAEDLEALCRRAIELGRERLDFDRLSIWFLADDHVTMQGTYGVDEAGQITDERQETFSLGLDFPSWQVMHDQTPLLHRKDVPLALAGRVVGQGEHVTAGLWDGEIIIGYISVDNFLRQQPFSDSDCQLIRLYANALGHLISLKRAGQELRTSEERYRMLAENMTDTIWLMDLNMKTTYISPSVTRTWGYTLEELNAIPLDQQMAPESFALFVRLFTSKLTPRHLAESDSPVSATLELELYRKDGSSLWSENTYSLIRDSQGQPLTILGSGRDITKSKQALEALQNSEKRFRALIENNTDAIVLIDPRGRILFESPAYGRMMGRDIHARLGHNGLEYVHPEDLPIVTRILTELVQSPGRNAQATFRLQHSNGSWRWLEITAANLLADSAVQAIVLNLHDITERLQAQEALANTERIYRQAITRTGGVPYQRNYDSKKYIFLGEGIESLTGFPPEELTGELFASRLRQVESYGELKDLPHDERFWLTQDARGIKEWREDYLFERKDGSLVWLADHAVQVKDAAENPLGFLGILLDITQRKQAEQDLRQRLAELEVLYETGLHISSLMTPKEIGQKVIEVLSEKLSWRHASIRLYQPETQRLELLVFNRPGLTTQQLQTETRRLNRTIAKPGQGFSGWVVQHGQSIRSGDVNSDPRFVRTFKGIRSGLYVPMQVGGRTTGVIGVESELPDAFTQADERMLATLAAQAGIAMENARLLAETLRQVEELAALADVSSALRTTLTRSEIVSVILDQLMMGLFQNDDACLVAYNPATGVNTIEAVRGNWSKKQGLRLAPGEGLSGLLAQTHLPYQNEAAASDTQPLKAEFSERREALAGVPLLVQDQFIGSLWIGRLRKKGAQDPVPFTSAEMRLLESVADMAANALQRSSLYEQTLRHAEELLEVNNMGRSLAETLDLDQIYEKLDQSVWQLFDDISLVAIALFDQEKQQINCVRFNTDSGLGDPASLPPAPLEPPGQGTQSQAIHTRQPVIVNNLREKIKDLKFQMNVGSDDGPVTQSGLYVPMLAHGRVIGVLQVQSYTPDRFDQSDADLLSLAANTAAADIENAHLFAETQKRLRNLSALHEIDIAISASVDIHITLDILLEQTVSGLNADAATVLLLNPQARNLEYIASHGFRNHQLRGQHIPLGVGLAGQAALRRQVQSATDLSEAASQESRFSIIDVYSGEGFLAHYAIPLSAKGQVQGVLEVFLRSSFQPDSEWFSFLETLSRQAAIAIDNNNLFDNLQRSNTNIVLAYDATIQGWSQALELRDKETEGHARRVTERTVQLAQLVGVPSAELEHVRRGTLLHDIGKMGIPDAILLKPGKLTDEEWVIMRRHPVLAYEMLSSIAYLRPALDIPHYHHERWDGSGYPEGLKGEQIPLYARIFAVVDVYDALTNDRPYRPAWTTDQAIEYLHAEAGKQFDPVIVETFLNMLAREK